MGGGQKITDAGWIRLRNDYEAGQRKVAEIAVEAGLSVQKLAALARQRNWRLRGQGRPQSSATRETIARLKSLLQRRLGELEARIGNSETADGAASGERDIRAMHTLVRTLEKVLELDREDRARRARGRKLGRRYDDAEREALARKLSGLREEIGLDEEAAQGAGPGGGGQPQP
jgi:hypothetical protein